MTSAGAPLRFLGLVLGGWIAVRTVALWPTMGAQAFVPAPLLPSVRPAAVRVVAAAMPAALSEPLPTSGAAGASMTLPRIAAAARAAPTSGPALSRAAVPAVAQVDRPGAPPAAIATVPDPRSILALASFVHYGEPAPPDRPAPSPRRLSASAWGIVRAAGTGGSAVVTPQLGGSQAGARFAYALDDARRLAATLRVAGALGAPDRELAPGVEWRVPRTPLRLFVEQRIALARGRGGTTLGAIVGVTRPLPGRFELAAYAQGGVIARGRGEAFVDGAARASRPVAHLGGAAIDVGVGSWGAAQRGASRIDVGPTIGVSVPVAGAHLRLAADWRERVAGNARPASGPALSIGADF